MRALAAVALGVALLGPVAAWGQANLDPKPAVWRGTQMGPEQLFEGDYTVDYQTSAFHADGAPAGQDDWLAGWEDGPADDGGIVRRYHIRFVGRRTVEPGRFGSLGRYPNEVLITRLISRRLLITH